jgi:FkbM family methyltransferase
VRTLGVENVGSRSFSVAEKPVRQISITLKLSGQPVTSALTAGLRMVKPFVVSEIRKMSLATRAKSTAGMLLARALSVGTSLIRREPIHLSAYEWRRLRFSFGQLGEDLVIVHLLEEYVEHNGFYVDVGAFDPVLYSNTLLLHWRGWRGINVDANPASIELFRQYRPHDRNLCMAVSDRVETLNYMTYVSGATNRLVEPSDSSSLSLIGETATNRIALTTTTLSMILEESGIKPGGVDFLNVDCEGLDLRVLKGLDWSRWKPRLVAVETHTQDDFRAVNGFLVPHGYTCSARVSMTSLFVRA